MRSRRFECENDGEFAEMGQERERAASGTVGIGGGVCRAGSRVIRRGVEAGRSVPGGLYGRISGAFGARIARNRAVSPRIQRFRGFRRGSQPTPGRPYGPLKGRFVLDAKWKRLDPGAPNHGGSQDDAYQLFAYWKGYGRRRVVLVYPRTAAFRKTCRFRFVGDPDLELACFPFNVSDAGESVRGMMGERWTDRRRSGLGVWQGWWVQTRPVCGGGRGTFCKRRFTFCQADLTFYERFRPILPGMPTPRDL